jgi:RNA polymerase subunit RPABC4/transcription elongation factor Spt4
VAELEAEVKEFDLTPDPRVLVALTHTPLQPLDALCELIDNSLDSFRYAALHGQPTDYPLITVELPGPAELGRDEGHVRIRDNGPGLPAEMAEKSVRAGYSGNKNPYDTLGLFGMGFNISTGKLGRVTRFMTAERGDELALQVVIDLVDMQDKQSYKVPVARVEKPSEFDHGTIIEVESPWPAGSANWGFVRQLVNYGKPTIRREIGRRYATILRRNQVRILINGEACEPFEHCVWDKGRSVERQGWGRIPARFDLDEVVSSQTRCTECSALLEPGQTACPSCGSESLRTIEERVRGWIGIQRFDDQTDFGIDLIRNGRTIRIGEQSAFFEHTDEFKKTIKDYPIDSPYGRIVGELHLDHVPVDFLKEDFQRSTEEWHRAMEFLRGKYSLQPQHWPENDKNSSAVSKLFQGYRRVRVPGTRDMYMGYWDAETDKPKRISREVEREYYEKFLDQSPGFHDDAEWWKKVEEADRRPIEELAECPNCGAQNLKSAEACPVCDHVLLGKPCANAECGKTIAQSALVCPHCGTSQLPEITQPWTCAVCASANPSDAETCAECGKPRGTPDPASRDYLLENSDREDDLSLSGLSIPLADGSHSNPIDIDVYATRGPLVPRWQGTAVPSVVFKSDRIEIFVDKGHAVFRSYRLRPEGLVAGEVAQFLYDANRRLVERHPAQHSQSNLSWQVLERRWGEQLEDSPERVSEDIRGLFASIREKLPLLAGGQAEDLFDELSNHQKQALVENMLGHGQDVSKLGEAKNSGEFLRMVDEEAIVDTLRRHPDLFFDGRIWDVGYSNIPGLDQPIVDEIQARVRAIYLNCLEDCSAFLRYRTPETIITFRARASVDFLGQKLA